MPRAGASRDAARGARVEGEGPRGPSPSTRENHTPRSEKRQAPAVRMCGRRGPAWREAGGAPLSRAPGRSIIAAGALNGRVRDGNGCSGPAMATSQDGTASGTSKETLPVKSGGERRKVPAPRLYFISAAPAAPDALRGGGGGQASRPIRTLRLSASPRLRLGPADPVVSRGPSEACAWDCTSPGGLGA